MQPEMKEIYPQSEKLRAATRRKESKITKTRKPNLKQVPKSAAKGVKLRQNSCWEVQKPWLLSWCSGQARPPVRRKLQVKPSESPRCGQPACQTEKSEGETMNWGWPGEPAELSGQPACWGFGVSCVTACS